MKKTFLFVLAVVFVSFLFLSLASCEDKTNKELQKAPATKEDLLKDILDDLENQDEILEVMPAIKAQKGQDGKVLYTYNGVKLEDMSKEDLANLSGRVGQLAVKFRTERIQRQLETAKQATRVPAPRAPVMVPAVPQLPRTTATPPSSPPRPAPAPTAPPTRR